MRSFGSQLLLLTTLLLISSPPAYSVCETTWARLLPVHHTAATRPFGHTPYRDARADSNDGKNLKTLLTKALAEGTLDSPEAIFGLLDAWNPDASSNFLAQMRWLQSQGITPWFRNQAFPYGWSKPDTVNAGGGKLQDVSAKPSKSLLPSQPTWWPPFLTRPKHLTLKFPDVAPRTPEELMALVYSYTTALALYRLDHVSSRAPLLSLPFGTGSWSYPQKLIQELQIAERHIYQNLKMLADVFPDVKLPLPENDKVWKAQWAQTSWELVSRVLWPRYDAFKAYRPNVEHFKKFEEDVANTPKPNARTFPKLDDAESNFRVRARLDWVVDRWRDTLYSIMLVNLWNSAQSWYDDWKHGGLKEWWRDIKDRKKKYSPERLNKAVESYQEDPDGFDLVNDHYNRQIDELKAKINKHGDPDGKLDKEIKKLEKSRDDLSK